MDGDGDDCVLQGMKSPSLRKHPSRENDYHQFTSSEEEEMMIDELEGLILFSVLLEIK